MASVSANTPVPPMGETNPPSYSAHNDLHSEDHSRLVGESIPPPSYDEAHAPSQAPVPTSVGTNLSASTSSSSLAGPTLIVNFQYLKYHAVITEKGSTKPLYIADMKKFRAPHILFKDPNNNNEQIGTGTLHFVHINADFDVRGQAGNLRPLHKFKTAYTHLSHTYGDAPEAMTWKSDWDFKTWDFICLDSNQNPVAKFCASNWNLKKFGKIVFMGPKANEKAFQEEIMIVGITLFFTMVLRMNSIFSFFGAIFASTGPLEEGQAGSSSSSGSSSRPQDAQMPQEIELPAFTPPTGDVKVAPQDQ